MKFIILLSVFSAQMAWAASVKTKVLPFSGSAAVAVSNLRIQQAELKISNHFCSIGTCAGGPTFEKALASEVKISGDLRGLQFKSLRTDSFSSGVLFGNFWDCSILIKVTAMDEAGKQQSGEGIIAESGDVAVCANEKSMKAMIDAKLAKPLTIKSWNNERLQIN